MGCDVRNGMDKVSIDGLMDLVESFGFWNGAVRVLLRLVMVDN